MATQITPAGKMVRLIGLAAFLAGIYVGFLMTVSSIGVDSTSLTDISNAHPVSCGAALHPDFGSVACDQALSGRKTASLVLLIGGGIIFVGAGQILKEERPLREGEEPAKARSFRLER